MQHIRTQREIFRQIVKPHCDDVYDFLQLANWWKENFLRDVEREFTDRQNIELTRYMTHRLSEIWNLTAQDLDREFVFYIEKNRWYPLWMWELADIEEWALSWAKDNGYGYLYED